MSEFLRGLRERPIMSLTAVGMAGGLTLALAGCSESTPPITQGSIITKQHHPAATRHVLIPIPHRICTGGKIKSCSTYYTYLPMTVHDAESWKVTIENCDQRESVDKACPRRSLNLTPNIFDQVEVGDYYEVPSATTNHAEAGPTISTQLAMGTANPAMY